MTESKRRYQSKTVGAGVLILVYALSKFFGIEISEAEVTEILRVGTELVIGILVIYGRVTANKKLT